MAKNSELVRLLWLPWTILRDTTPEGDVILRVKEIPSVIGAGESDTERERDMWESLTESLFAYLHFGDTVPAPVFQTSVWEVFAPLASESAAYWRVGVTRTRNM